MNRNEQIILGRKIRKLIEKNFNSGFSSRFQGAGKVATLVVSASSKSFIGKIKFYLKNELRLELHNGSKNHGSGEKNTIQVALSDLSQQSILIIEEQFKVILENSKKKVTEKSQEEKGLEKAEEKIVNTLKGPKMRVLNFSPSTKFIRKISPFLNGIFRFESTYLPSTENLFEFNKNETDEEYLTIHCLNEKVAKEIELAAVWFSGNPDLVIREGTDLIINFSDITKKEKEPSWVSFCFPPQINAELEEVVARLRRVRSGSTPQVTKEGDSSFCVTYVRTDVVPKIYDDLKKMGWTVKPKDIKSFIVECQNDYPVLKEPVVPNDFEKVNLETIFCQDSSFKRLSNKGFSAEEAEALQKLKDLESNQELFNLLSPETKEEIINLLEELRQKEKRQKVELYAKSLISVFRK